MELQKPLKYIAKTIGKILVQRNSRFEKTFDQKPLDVVWWALWKPCTEQWLVKIVQSME